MSEITATALTLEQARDLTDEVKADAAALWAKLLTLYEGKAHAALGYSSWGNYYEKEFGQSGTHGYRLLDSARVVLALPETHSPIGEWTARPLAPILKDEGPEAVEEVWGEVVEQHGPAPTAAQVREVIQTRKPDEEPVEPVPSQEVTLTKRQADMSNAARTRLASTLHNLDGMCRGLGEADLDRVAATSSTREVAEWEQITKSAIKTLKAFQRALSEGGQG